MSSRPSVTEALDIRSDERVVVISHPECDYQYPENWTVAGNEIEVDQATVIVVDRTLPTRQLFVDLASCSSPPRLFAFVAPTVEQEKQVRRMVTSLYPWSEVWTVWTSLGKTLITAGAKGRPYDRDEIPDRRPEVSA